MDDETARFELHEGLREALGESRGDTLMSLLPPVGWADVATNHDLDALGNRLEARIDGVDARIDGVVGAIGARFDGVDVRIDGVVGAIGARFDAVQRQIDALRESTAAQIENARLASEKAMAELEARMHRDMLRLTWSMIGGFVAVAGVLTANSVL